MPKLLITRNIGPDAMAIVDKTGYEVALWPHDSTCDRAWLLENVKGADAICLLPFDKVDEELVTAAGPQLKVISTFSVGYDHFDLQYLKSLQPGRKIRLGYTPDVLNEAVADIAIMLYLMASRRVEEGVELVRQGKWPVTPWSPFHLTGPSLNEPNITIGFLGFGRISQVALTRFLAFTKPKGSPDGPRCIYRTSRTRDNQAEIDAAHSAKFGIDVKHVELDELARESDVLVLLCNLSESTKGIIGKEFLGKMKKRAILVNTARGGVVDSFALDAALKEGQIFAAGVDVVDGEPNVSSDHPLVTNERCIILPHVGSATEQCRKAMAAYCAQNAIAALTGEEMPAELHY